MNIDIDLLTRFSPDATKFWDGVNQAADHYQINTPKRICAFLAQVAHESDGFKYVKELASGSAYEGRIDLGNTEAGDGVRFKGRGLIQITGRTNYRLLSQAFDVDFVGEPELLEGNVYAALSAGWFWEQKNLNQWADIGDDPAFQRITRRINGGLNGLASREEWWARAKSLWPEEEA